MAPSCRAKGTAASRMNCFQEVVVDLTHEIVELSCDWQLRSMLDELTLSELTISTSASDLLLAACYENAVQDEVGPCAGSQL